MAKWLLLRRLQHETLAHQAKADDDEKHSARIIRSDALAVERIPAQQQARTGVIDVEQHHAEAITRVSEDMVFLEKSAQVQLDDVNVTLGCRASARLRFAFQFVGADRDFDIDPIIAAHRNEQPRMVNTRPSEHLHIGRIADQRLRARIEQHPRRQQSCDFDLPVQRPFGSHFENEKLQAAVKHIEGCQWRRRLHPRETHQSQRKCRSRERPDQRPLNQAPALAAADGFDIGHGWVRKAVIAIPAGSSVKPPTPGHCSS